MRRARNCDGETSAVAFPFAPDLNRCPWSQITSEAQEFLSWWLEWRMFKVLPYGSETLADEPAYVLEAFSACESQKLEPHEIGDGSRGVKSDGR